MNNIYCPSHKDEPVTNYCCIKNCSTPLCPDCIDSHIKSHKINGQTPEIDILSRIKKMCRSKLSLTT